MAYKNNNTQINKGFYKKISQTLNNIREVGSGTLIFKFHDESITSLPFSMELFSDERGRRRDYGSIISILNDIKHDYRAQSWEIN